MKIYMVADHNNISAFDRISRTDIEAYLAEHYPEFYIASTDDIEGVHQVGPQMYVDVVFLETVNPNDYVRLVGNYQDIATFIDYDERFDGCEVLNEDDA